MKSNSIVYAAAEKDMLGIQARELSSFGSGLPGWEPETTLHDASALQPLGHKQFLSMTEFTGELSVTLSTTCRAADKLVRKHVVKRGRSLHERRLVLISLSGKGLRLTRGCQETTLPVTPGNPLVPGTPGGMLSPLKGIRGPAAGQKPRPYVGLARQRIESE